MLNRTHLKTTLLFLCCCLLSACIGTTETAVRKNDSTEALPQTANQTRDAETENQTDNTSEWEHAYGEPLAKQNNKPPQIAVTQAPPPASQQITNAPPKDLWQRIRNGYGINDYGPMRDDTKAQLKWFVEHPDYVNRVVDRARPYLHYIVDQLEERNMPLELALLPIVESGYQPYAYSHGRAAGLWQFIPGTGKLYGLKQDWWYDGRRDVIASTRAALDYLQKLHSDFGDWELALAAYNCGEGTVSRAIKYNQKRGKPTDFWDLNLPTETSAYVPKLMAVARLVKDPQKYNITLSPIDNSPFLTVVDVGSQIDLSLAAKMAGISTDELYELNPGYNRWATAPNGPHHLVLPLDKADNFEQALQEMPAKDRVQWTRHQIHHGESLGSIAKHYRTTIAVLKKANGLNSNIIRAGHHLLIPVASGKPSDYPMTVTQRLAQTLNASHAGRKHTYTVQKGDTWWDIARKYNVHVNKLAKWNGKAPGDVLRPGQKLVLWTHENKSVSSRTVRTINYTIRDGDSLWKISRKFNVTVAQVREWNDLSSRTLLSPGQNLTLHVDVTAQQDRI